MPGNTCEAMLRFGDSKSVQLSNEVGDHINVRKYRPSIGLTLSEYMHQDRIGMNSTGPGRRRRRKAAREHSRAANAPLRQYLYPAVPQHPPIAYNPLPDADVVFRLHPSPETSPPSGLPDHRMRRPRADVHEALGRVI